ncbi:putative EF-hand domain, sodium/calcium exchanger membrane region, EF-hand domain pair [Helianthus anomalus]
MSSLSPSPTSQLINLFVLLPSYYNSEITNISSYPSLITRNLYLHKPYIFINHITQPNYHFKMKKMVATIACFSAFFLFLLDCNVTARSLQYDDSEQFSDGVSNVVDNNEGSLLLPLKGTHGSEEQCEQMYGFLPCSNNLPGHLFLIVVYEYLLYHGESYAGGDGRIFGVLGNNFFGASVFQLLDSLPDSLILLASGLSSSKEKAQDYVVTGAGLLAGSSIFLLTLLWGVCLICGRRMFYAKPDSKVQNKGIQLLTGSGVVTDAETSYHAKVMFFSLVPFLVILLPSVFGLSYSSQGFEIAVLVSLCVSVICLFAYFIYQLFDERIQKRRLEYAEVERKVELHVPFYEVQSLMLDREKNLMIRQKEMEKMMKSPENRNKTMTREEFCDMFEDWLDVTRQLMDDPYSLDKSGTEYNEVANLLLEDKNQLIELISLMIDRASGQKLLKEDGAQDEYAIDRFFERIDTNQNGFISKSELKNFIMEVNYEEILMDDEIAEIIMRHLDIDGNGNIDKQEFKSGFTKWLKEIDRATRTQKKLSHANNRETDSYKRAEAKAKVNQRLKAIILLIVGIFMLTVLAEPLVESVREFSESAEIEPFYVSFILVPLATNARTAIAAIRAANQKRHQTTSLTFSEIYHKVFMNNILGFSVLVSVIYFRGLTWHFSAEVLVVIIVCVIMGLLASVRSKFPCWTLLIAVPLYPLSLVVVYFVDDSFRST